MYGTRAMATSDHTRFVSIWELQETYKIKVVSAKNANVAEGHKVCVCVGGCVRVHVCEHVFMCVCVCV